jgi:hypothetical protein
MSALMLLLEIVKQRKLVTKTYVPGTYSFTVPPGVTKLTSLIGKGGVGTPATTGTRTVSSQVDSVQGHASGSGSAFGTLSWSDFQGDNSSALSAINAGGSGFFYGVVYDGFPNANSYSIALYQGTYADAVPGTASIVTSPGWQTSGVVGPADYGFSRIEYSQNYSIPAVTGPDTTAFGKTFPGGTGGAASSAQYADWPVTPGQTYTLTVAANGSLSFTYYQ